MRETGSTESDSQSDGQGAYKGDQTDRYKVWVTSYSIGMALWPASCASHFYWGKEWSDLHSINCCIPSGMTRHFNIDCSTEIHFLEITWIPCRKVRTSRKKVASLTVTMCFFPARQTKTSQGVWPWNPEICEVFRVHHGTTTAVHPAAGDVEEIDVVVCASLVDNVQTLVWFGHKRRVSLGRIVYLDNKKLPGVELEKWKTSMKLIVFYRDLDVVGYDHGIHSFIRSKHQSVLRDSGKYLPALR